MAQTTTRRIWVQLLTTIAAALTVVWIGVIIWQSYTAREAALAQAEEFSMSMHDATMAGLTGMMVTGTVAQRDVFLDQIKQLGYIRDVRVIRGEAVSKLFGPGTAKDTTVPDSVEAEVMKTGKPIVGVELKDGVEYLRAVRPTLAYSDYLGKDCTSCHQVPEATVLGAVSMRLSLESVNAGLAAQRWKSILAAILTSIPVLMLIYPFIRKVVTQPLSSGVQAARRIASGDLTQEIAVTSDNEVGELQQALKDMNASLTRIVSQVRTGTDTIFIASREIAAGNTDLSHRTELQAGTLEKTAEAMHQLTATVNQNADNARKANQLAASASEVAVRGGGAVAQVVETMESINASSRRIEDIIGVIDGIAFQTNILALNAAVEAARAGEQGRGFAVVAQEVRALAGRSAAAAREVKKLIDESVSKVEAGSAQVNQAGATMDEIVQSIGHVAGIMGEIANASMEQTAGIEQVNTSISEMNSVTQQNAAMVEQAAAGAQQLQDQAGNLERVVNTFKLSA
ncbi:methyl-accepting chemotaxis protein [Curvibacter sp. APW13]|uniref:methyl-accepting chemotaxis protein n=1 Tax=Curvibacter sp. APW13 TaxID=3077236 RepID=UPI0028DE3F5F|nr:methyl-accepting chemotaxis protein [Curvibacter sp. APW13]MDT8991085.1 methyl-accepting chemotaxis protein [Curvibacter sp. APW13]